MEKHQDWESLLSVHSTSWMVNAYRNLVAIWTRNNLIPDALDWHF